MRSLWKDILAAFFMGMVVPGLMLNIAAMGLRHRSPIPEIQISIPAPTEPERDAVPILLRRDGSTVEIMDMDTYLVKVLLAEVPASFEAEALKAQAVAARTYAGKARETGGKHGDGSVCTSSGCCQAYLEPEDYLKQGGTEEGIDAIRAAVLATSGQYLQYEGELIEATYFSCSGGSTETALAVWGSDYPYLQAVDSPGEEEARWHTDRVTFTADQFFEALGMEPDENRQNWFGSVTRTEGGGVQTMVIAGEVFTGTQLRSLLGLRSTALDVAVSGDAISVTTRGYGHRVGLSQYGAEAMAAGGSTYEEILAHYYPGTELVSKEY